VILLLKVIKADLNMLLMKLPLPLPPLSSQQVLSADKEGKQVLSKVVRKLQ